MHNNCIFYPCGRRVPDEAPAAVAELLTQLLSFDAAARPSANVVIERIQELDPNCRRSTSLPMSAATSAPGPVSGAEAGAPPSDHRPGSS